MMKAPNVICVDVTNRKSVLGVMKAPTVHCCDAS